MAVNYRQQAEQRLGTVRRCIICEGHFKSRRDQKLCWDCLNWQLMLGPGDPDAQSKDQDADEALEAAERKPS